MTAARAVLHRSTMDVPADLIAFAQELARAARAETLGRWAQACPAENKGGEIFDPVTEADREAERVMRDLIASRHPGHGVTGEEWPDQPGAGPWSWSLDPIDGTRSFICRLPSWVTLIALLDDHRPILGLVDAPCLDETYVGFGKEAWMERKGERTPIASSNCVRLSDARLSTTDPIMFDGPPWPAFDRLRRTVKTVRYGYDGYAYARLAAGSIDLVVETSLKPHDYNAVIPLIEAAGGTIGDWRGGRDFGRGKLIAAATRQLYDEAVGAFTAFA
ncbi:MAG: inositol monophosphatase family protein [Sphingomicrobium sp.]